MGLFDKIASRFVPELGDVEQDMAGNPNAPAELLRKMAEKEPKLWETILANPSCPSDVAAYIQNRRTE
ncbi:MULTISPECIES: hypothetical protein [Arthrobacter]|uniref:Leucine rich repeat variant domain-containing protein n=1 Tax=Arthrobacter terricola TaxID=2547396 RepID=A0A4R5KD84_9MICC|nr:MULTISPECIES: hypothetical protein [Arthrobacter]MBT8162592.1 hypothetical protein [Arthrobacter sp. GN70]TDF92852.1 hypothetical protein E1809_16970 [Arthrobacter terricola]